MPVHTATGPQQLVSQNITYLPTVIRGKYFFLYLFLDVWSRKIVGWEVHESEDDTLAAGLLARMATMLGSLLGLVLHADNGGPMRGAMMLAKMQQLGVMPSFSRPRVSNDNPFSEAAFRTPKYVRRGLAQPTSRWPQEGGPGRGIDVTLEAATTLTLTR